MAISDQLSDGSATFVTGMDSYSQPFQLELSAYVAGMNVTCRGGIVKTRPGSRTMFRLPEGNLQGMTLFTPTSGYPYLVCAVEGEIYVSASPFNTYTKLEGIQFNPQSKFVCFASCLQTTAYDNNGELYFLDIPKSVLVMQDGNTRAAFWDGSTARHLDPTYSSGEVTEEGKDETPIGLWSVWSNNRLWVSRGNQIFASDIGNPLKFTEAQYINEARAFYLPSTCTGMVETPDQEGILMFTESEAIYLQSSIQNRLQWLSTPGFQRTILHKIGCVAPRSIVTQYGLIWWFSAKGLISLDAAIRSNATSKITIEDNEMMASKYAIGSDLSGICGASHENFLLMSVPHGDRENTHTWALDQDPFNQSQANAWAGFWTGWRPVCWASGQIFSEERTFMASRDYDGANRVWEAFTDDFTDNGTPIECYLQTREYTFNTPDRKRFEYAEIFACEVYGPVELAVFVAGQKGAYQKICSKSMIASPGQVIYGQKYGPDEDPEVEEVPLLLGNRPQFRTIKTAELGSPSDCNACGVESTIPNNIDRAFSLLVVWHGQMAVNAIRMFARQDAENFGGACEDDEIAPRSLNFEGCASNESLFIQSSPFERYESTTEQCLNVEGQEDPVCATATATTIISQEAANRLAIISAREKAAYIATHQS